MFCSGGSPRTLASVLRFPLQTSPRLLRKDLCFSEEGHPQRCLAGGIPDAHKGWASLPGFPSRLTLR